MRHSPNIRLYPKEDCVLVAGGCFAAIAVAANRTTEANPNGKHSYVGMRVYLVRKDRNEKDEFS